VGLSITPIKSAEIQVSHKLMPFLVELSIIHNIFFTRCMSLKVNGRSACTSFAKNGKVLTARISVDELRLFYVGRKYNRYALLNERVLQVAKRELKNFMILANAMFILNSRRTKNR
jgi:hypothetical protein